MDICSIQVDSLWMGFLLLVVVVVVLCHVTDHLLVVHGFKDVVLSRAVVVACAGLDKHHLLLHDLAILALELHGEGCGSVGGAAATIGADAAKLGPVGLGGGAARNLKLHGLGDTRGADALFPFPNFLFQVRFTGANHAEARLLFQTALSVVISDTGRDSQATRL